MAVFLVERDLAGVTLDGLAGAKAAATAEAARMREKGVPVWYLRSTFVPEDGRCMCLFEAESESVIVALNQSAGLPYHTIVAAYDLTPQAIRGA